jgi:hypothetical protein
MRCRKVRSYLSAYCSSELQGRRRLAISEHLSSCPSCRREEAVYRSMREARSELTRLSVSKGFNSRLMERVARERFAETRTRPYFPKPVPAFSYKTLIPALASTAVVVLLALALILPNGGEVGREYASNRVQLDDSYLTAQPVNNPNMAATLNEDWSLSRQLARNERITELSKSLLEGPDLGFGASDLMQASSGQSRPVPYVRDYYRVRPLLKVYISPGSVTDREATKVY